MRTAPPGAWMAPLVRTQMRTGAWGWVEPAAAGRGGCVGARGRLGSGLFRAAARRAAVCARSLRAAWRDRVDRVDRTDRGGRAERAECAERVDDTECALCSDLTDAIDGAAGGPRHRAGRSKRRPMQPGTTGDRSEAQE